MAEEVVGFAARVIAAPFLLWRGWESNETEEKKLTDFLAHASQSLRLADSLPQNELENLLMDLACIDKTMKRELGEMPTLTRVTAPAKVASEIAGLKSQAEGCMERFRDRIAIDTHNISFDLRRSRKASLIQYERMFAEIQRLGDKVEALDARREGEVKRLTDDIQHHIGRKLHLEHQARLEQARAKAAEQEVEEQSEKIGKLEGQLADVEAILRRTEEDEAQARQDLVQLRRRVEDLRQSLDDAREALKKATSDLEKANKNIVKLTQELATRKTDIDTLFAKVTAHHTARPWKARAATFVKNALPGAGRSLSDARPITSTRLQEASSLKATVRAKPSICWALLVSTVLASLAFFGAGLWPKDFFRQAEVARVSSAASWLINVGQLILAAIGWILRAAGCILLAVACGLQGEFSYFGRIVTVVPNAVSRDDVRYVAHRHGDPIVGFVLLGGTALVISGCLLYLFPLSIPKLPDFGFVSVALAPIFAAASNLGVALAPVFAAASNLIDVYLRFAFGWLLWVAAILCILLAIALVANPCAFCFLPYTAVFFLLGWWALGISDTLLGSSQGPQLVNREFLEGLSPAQIAELLKLVSSHDVPSPLQDLDDATGSP